jgi:hypothetical protein
MADSVSKPPYCNAVWCQLEMGESLHMALDNHDLLNLDWKPMRKRDSLILPLKSGLKDEQLRVLKDLSFVFNLT